MHADLAVHADAKDLLEQLDGALDEILEKEGNQLAESLSKREKSSSLTAEKVFRA